MKIFRAGILLGIVLCAFNGFAQTDTTFLARAIGSLEKYSAAYPVEKVHLHFDKQGYMPGDTIWFKVYTVAGADHGLSAISSIVHVELLTEKDSVINRLALPLSSGVSWGDFALPVLIKTGNYHIRAYTNWMRNFSPDYFFDQRLRVSETQTAIANKKQKSTANPDVQFFPEGGSLINGLRSKVAIKAIGTNGMGEDVEGSVVDNDGTEVSVFSCQHLGMGVFAITPQPGKSYKAKITRKDGKQFAVTIPKAQDDGFTIAINNSQPDSLSIRVAASPRLFDAKKGAKYYLLAQSGAKVYYTADFKLSAQSFTTLINKKRFPTGIVQFTLFANNGEPLNERIAFICHDDQLKLSITSPQTTYTTRQKVAINIKTTNKDGKTVLGSFSAGVINQDLLDTNPEYASSIFSSLLLTSDIKGYVERPAYYFNNLNNTTNANLDLLMLTQGYRRLEWKEVINQTYPAITYQPENSLSVSGVIKTFGGKPIPKGRLMLYNMRGGFFKLDTLADDNGRFTFNGLIPNPDTTLKYVIQGRTGSNKNKLDITLDTIAAFKQWKSPDYTVAQADTTVETIYLKQVKQQIKTSLDKRIIPLQEVKIKFRKEILSNSGQTIRPDQTITDFSKDGSALTVSQFLAVRIRGAIFKNGIPYSTRSMGKIPMNIVLDGFVIDPLLFQSIDISSIESAYVLTSTGNIDNATGTGGLFLVSKKNRGGIKQITPDVIIYQSIGLYKAKEFYAPKYDVAVARQQPDLRTTIYWKPDIITDKDGNATLSFYNADTRGNYCITIEGLDIDGNIGRQVYTYKVE